MNELRKHVPGFYVSQASIIHFVRFQYSVVFRIIYVSVRAVRRKTFIAFTRRDYHLKRSMFLAFTLRKHHYSSFHIYNYAFAFFIHFQYSIFSCCFVFADIRKMYMAFTLRNYHISNFPFSNAIPDAGSFLCCDRTALTLSHLEFFHS